MGVKLISKLLRAQKIPAQYKVLCPVIHFARWPSSQTIAMGVAPWGCRNSAKRQKSTFQGFGRAWCWMVKGMRFWDVHYTCILTAFPITLASVWCENFRPDQCESQAEEGVHYSYHLSDSRHFFPDGRTRTASQAVLPAGGQNLIVYADKIRVEKHY